MLKLTKRLEDLTQESSALKTHLVPQLQALNNIAPELVNFGISVSFAVLFHADKIFIFSQLAQQVMPHLSDVRSSKSAFQLATVLGFVNQIADSTVGKGLKEPATSWEAVVNFFGQVMQDANKVVPLALENENVLKSKELFHYIDLSSHFIS